MKPEDIATLIGLVLIVGLAYVMSHGPEDAKAETTQGTRR